MKEPDFVNLDEVRVFAAEGRVYIDIEDLQIALQYDVNTNMDALSELPGFNDDKADVLTGFVDLIFEGLEQLKTQVLEAEAEENL